MRLVPPDRPGQVMGTVSMVISVAVGACEDEMRRAGADHVVLAVMEDNVAGRRAYRRLGFTDTGRVDVLADGRRELWMVKLLR
ncbi:GNAT family N-acetyltransferase [Tessaracoccus sp. MC1865]|uniref:GNAT family N-acetyltransferase n=1 Tax=Tessaracoccus sp. MC1865 TaxID=2760310 RepID=UPI001603AB3C|nr:GNAT family N-acetyltransferase [Tessaracoccus sp. MC1865]MBB1483061.1 GNAT family N-acetyltransferase [Tessaracoccus sp. MC1865]QTO37508.1 GNAT family N-acetyltransferase [Tessaracoccus sp. MC1865]